MRCADNRQFEGKWLSITNAGLYLSVCPCSNIHLNDRNKISYVMKTEFWLSGPLELQNVFSPLLISLVCEHEMHFQVPAKADVSFGSWDTIGFSKRPLLHETGYTSNRIRIHGSILTENRFVGKIRKWNIRTNIHPLNAFWKECIKPFLIKKGEP